MPNLDEDLKITCTSALRKLCNACDMLPTFHTLPEGVYMEHPRARGEFAEVWIEKSRNRMVAVKVLNMCPERDLLRVKKANIVEAI